MMKKFAFVIAAALSLPACSDKNDYKQAVLADIKQEKDLKDYHISPETMADCVVELSSHRMPGFFDLDPERMTAYRNYAKMLTMMQAKDPKQAMEALRAEFGSPKALADAHANYNESMLECYTTVVSKSEGDEDEEEMPMDDGGNGQLDGDADGMDEDGAAGDDPGMMMEEGPDEPEENASPEAKLS